MGLIFRNHSPTSKHNFPIVILLASLIQIMHVTPLHVAHAPASSFFLAEAPISWQTRQQPSVALSTIK